jgi:hypothetical protein
LKKNLDPKSGTPAKKKLGWPANLTFFSKTQKRGLVLNLDLLKKNSEEKILLKKEKNTKN